MAQSGHSKSRGFYIFVWKMKRESSNRNRIFCTAQLVSAVTRVLFVSDSTSYIDLRGFWCNIIILNVHAPREEKSDKNIFKPTIWNESLRQECNDNCIRLVNFDTTKYLVLNCAMFSHRSIHK